jgi:hypothetical protein
MTPNHGTSKRHKVEEPINATTGHSTESANTTINQLTTIRIIIIHTIQHSWFTSSALTFAVVTLFRHERTFMRIPFTGSHTPELPKTDDVRHDSRQKYNCQNIHGAHKTPWITFLFCLTFRITEESQSFGAMIVVTVQINRCCSGWSQHLRVALLLLQFQLLLAVASK